MRLKFFPLFAALLLVAACQTAPEEGADVRDGMAAGAAGDDLAIERQADDEMMREGLDNGDRTGLTTRRIDREALGPGNIEAGTQADLEQNIGDRVFFEFDRAELDEEDRATINRWAAWLKMHPDATVILEGHCDERGTREYNIGLGWRRANAARNYLLSLGIAAERVETISYGKERPAVLGSSEAAWAQNRRSVMKLN